MKVNRDFEIKGAKFHLKDGKKFICKSKYIVVYYAEGFDWVEIGIANSKKEAIQIAKDFLKYR